MITEEIYEYKQMISLRLDAIESAKSAQLFGIVLGTLGRQGSPKIVQVILTNFNPTF